MFAGANYDVRSMVLRANGFEEFTVRLASSVANAVILLFLGQFQFGRDDELQQ